MKQQSLFTQNAH